MGFLRHCRLQFKWPEPEESGGCDIIRYQALVSRPNSSVTAALPAVRPPCVALSLVVLDASVSSMDRHIHSPRTGFRSTWTLQHERVGNFAPVGCCCDGGDEMLLNKISLWRAAGVVTAV